MCIYIIKIKNKLISRGWVHSSTERPKIGVSSMQDTAKTIKIEVCHDAHR